MYLFVYSVRHMAVYTLPRPKELAEMRRLSQNAHLSVYSKNENGLAWRIVEQRKERKAVKRVEWEMGMRD